MSAYGAVTVIMLLLLCFRFATCFAMLIFSILFHHFMIACFQLMYIFQLFVALCIILTPCSRA